jgi:hypothetical protein
MNMNKTLEVLQGPDESPSQVYEHLCEGSIGTPTLTHQLQKPPKSR